MELACHVAPAEKLAEENERLKSEIESLKAEIERLRRLLEEALRAGKRQAAPFSRREPKAHPQKPGRKAGERYGRNCRRPIPRKIDERVEVPLPERCPHCGGGVEEEEIVSQYQTESPNLGSKRSNFAFMWDAVEIVGDGCKADIHGKPRMRLGVRLRNSVRGR